MESIYLNNFRGFTKTLIPIHPVNFLVGENSTGKTSFLAIIQLLSDYRFWYDLDFNSGNYEFGGYKDIVSALSNNQSEFQIGIFVNFRNPFYCLLHFEEFQDGLPTLHRLTFLSNNKLKSVLFTENDILFASLDDTQSSLKGSSTLDYFNFLLDAPLSPSTKYAPLENIFKPHAKGYPIQSLINILNQYPLDTHPKREEYIPLPVSAPLVSMSPIRTTPKRTYDGYTKRFSADGEHTPYVIRKHLPTRKNSSNAFKKSLDDFGDESGLFQTVGVNKFGKDSASPFELTISLNKKAIRINSVGYGVSQVLPVIVELITLVDNSWFAIQQPEVHLHPKAQAALGNFFFNAANKSHLTLFIETHSDYLIDRFRINMHEDKHATNFAQILFFERSDKGNLISPMILLENGDYPENQPPSYREFFLNEHGKLLGL